MKSYNSKVLAVTAGIIGTIFAGQHIPKSSSIDLSPRTSSARAVHGAYSSSKITAAGISLNEAKRQSKFKMMLPQAETLTSAQVTKVLSEPNGNGSAFYVFYDRLEVAMSRVNGQLDLQTELKQEAILDFNSGKKQIRYKPVTIQGYKGVGNEPFTQALDNGTKNEVPAVVMFQVPDGDGFVTYTLYGERMPLGQLVGIANSMRAVE